MDRQTAIDEAVRRALRMGWYIADHADGTLRMLARTIEPYVRAEYRRLIASNSVLQTAKPLGYGHANSNRSFQQSKTFALAGRNSQEEQDGA